MINPDMRKHLEDIVEGAILFDGPAFDNSIIGVSTDGRVVYSWMLMVEELSKDEGISEEEAADFISYNTIRILDYLPENKPVIVDCEILL